MATKPKANAVTTTKDQLPATSVPDWMKADAQLGKQNIRSEDAELPRVQLLQALSPQVAEGDEKAGHFFHTLLEESLGDTLRAIIVYTDVQYILWRPRHEGGGILARADDGVHWNPANTEFEVQPSKDSPKKAIWATTDTVASSGLDKFGSSVPGNDDSPPAAVKMYNYVVILPDFPEYGPMVLTLQKGSQSVGKKLNGKLKMFPGPVFGQTFEITNVKADTGKGTFYRPVFTRTGIVENKAEYDSYKELHDLFAGQGIRIRDVEGLNDDGESTSSGADETPEGGIEV